MRIKTIKESDFEWTVWNRTNGETASIIKISEYSLLPTKTKYRVDFNGRTIASMIENFQTAKSVAYKAVKDNQ